MEMASVALHNNSIAVCMVLLGLLWNCGFICMVLVYYNNTAYELYVESVPIKVWLFNIHNHNYVKFLDPCTAIHTH